MYLVVEKLSSLLTAAAMASQAAAVELLDDESSVARARTYFEMAAGLFELALVHLEENSSLDEDFGARREMAIGPMHHTLHDRVALISWSPLTLKMLLSLMLAQAQECHWKQHVMQTVDRYAHCQHFPPLCHASRSPFVSNMEEESFPSMQEAAAVAKMYSDAKEMLNRDGCTAADILPDEWLGTVFAKAREFDAIARESRH